MTRIVPLAAAVILISCSAPPMNERDGGLLELDDGGSSLQPDAGSCAAELASDPLNCGACGVVCGAPLHAAAACQRGVCGRAACEPGFFDLDGQPGCEATCTGRTCLDGTGTTITLTSPPLAERGLSWHGPASGASWGSQVQTSTGFTHLGVLGETFSASTDSPTSTSAGFRHVGGLSAAQHVFHP